MNRHLERALWLAVVNHGECVRRRGLPLTVLLVRVRRTTWKATFNLVSAVAISCWLSHTATRLLVQGGVMQAARTSHHNQLTQRTTFST